MGFEGHWTVTYVTIKGQPLIGGSIDISAVIQNRFQITVSSPNGGGLPWIFTVPLDGTGVSFTHIEKVSGMLQGIKIVFDNPLDPQGIIEGPLCSQVERWSEVTQPSDMGTFTGTKGA